MNLYWLKLNANFDKDDRILHLENQKGGEIATLCYVKLLCMAGRSNMGGGVYMSEGVPHTVNTLASLWHKRLSTTQKVLELLENHELIEIEDGVIYISDWDDVQSADKLEEIRKQNCERQRKYREKRKQNVTLQRRYSNAVEEEIEIEKEKDIDEDEDIYESVRDRFNLITAAPKIVIFSDKQKQAVRTAIDRFGEELLYEAFRIAGDSEFLRGKNPKNWIPTFDWMINPDNITKVINGNYSKLYGEAPIDDGLETSFESHEFIEAALSRGFED